MTKCNLVYLDGFNKPKYVEGIEKYRFDTIGFFVFEDNKMNNVWIPYSRIIRVVMLDTKWIL